DGQLAGQARAIRPRAIRPRAIRPRAIRPRAIRPRAVQPLRLEDDHRVMVRVEQPGGADARVALRVAGAEARRVDLGVAARLAGLAGDLDGPAPDRERAAHPAEAEHVPGPERDRGRGRVDHVPAGPDLAELLLGCLCGVRCGLHAVYFTARVPSPG